MVERLFRGIGSIPGVIVGRGATLRVLPAVLIVAIVAAIPALAQTPGADTLRLGLDDLLARIPTVSPELLRGRLEVARANAARRGVSFFPSRPELEYSMATDAPFLDEGEREWELELTQEIELGGQYFLRGRSADLSIRQAELETRALELTIRAEARGAFVRLAAAEAQVRLIDTMLRFSRRLDTIAGRLLAAEEISELERNAVRIERGREEIERLAAMREVIESRAALARLLAIPPRTVITTVPVSPAGATDPAAYLDTARLIETALASGDETLLERRPDWQALDRLRERISTERTIASRSWIPNLRLGVGYISETRAFFDDHAPAAGATLETDRLLGLRLGIDLPLPFGGLYDLGQGEIAVADVELAIVEAERARLAAGIRADLARAVARLRVAAEAYALYTADVAPLIRRNLVLLERGYVGGELSATEVVSQQQQFLRAGAALIDAEREYMEALADYRRATGE